ncbi:MAG: prepilin-type N-terminal cleavage/methylation domain-containing protein [bacterium]
MELVKDETGFTLLEVLISLAIILILMLAFSSGIINSFRTESRVDQRLEAIRITDSIIEYLRANKENLGDIDNYFLSEIENDINNNETVYTIGTDNSSDIIIDSSNDGNLYLFEIEWPDRNYSTEVLLAGEE